MDTHDVQVSDAVPALMQVVFLVAGADKAATLARVLEGPYQPDTLPSQSIRTTAGRLGGLVDAAAAAQLERR